jgi:hypothetical protein
MTGDETPGVPMDAHPDPVLAYESSNGQLRVTATNDAFEAVYDDGTDAAGQRSAARRATGSGRRRPTVQSPPAPTGSR